MMIGKKDDYPLRIRCKSNIISLTKIDGHIKHVFDDRYWNFCFFFFATDKQKTMHNKIQLFLSLFQFRYHETKNIQITLTQNLDTHILTHDNFFITMINNSVKQIYINKNINISYYIKINFVSVGTSQYESIPYMQLRNVSASVLTQFSHQKRLVSIKNR